MVYTETSMNATCIAPRHIFSTDCIMLCTRTSNVSSVCNMLLTKIHNFHWLHYSQRIISITFKLIIWLYFLWTIHNSTKIWRIILWYCQQKIFRCQTWFFETFSFHIWNGNIWQQISTLSKRKLQLYQNIKTVSLT